MENWNTYGEHYSSDCKHLKLNLGIYPKQEKLEDIIGRLTKCSQNHLEEELNLLIQKEKEELNRLEQELEKWKILSQEIQSHQMALEYKKTANTISDSCEFNVWHQAEEYTTSRREEIQNKTYKMYISTYEETRYNSEIKDQEVIGWRVSWALYANTPIRNMSDTTIAFVRNKKFTDKEKLEKYISGRKAAYQKYFTEECPAILSDYKKCFCVNGVLLPGYRVEE